MNKTELVAAVAAKAELTKVDAKKALDATLLGFGTFSVNKRAARTGINPATKQKIKIAAKKVVKFKAGADLK